MRLAVLIAVMASWMMPVGANHFLNAERCDKQAKAEWQAGEEELHQTEAMSAKDFLVVTPHFVPTIGS